jgi:hypothetical protein
MAFEVPNTVDIYGPLRAMIVQEYPKLKSCQQEFADKILKKIDSERAAWKDNLKSMCIEMLYRVEHSNDTQNLTSWVPKTVIGRTDMASSSAMPLEAQPATTGTSMTEAPKLPVTVTTFQIPEPPKDIVATEGELVY